MTVLGAAFSSESAASAAERELVEQLHIDPGCLDRAPLGAVGRTSEGRLILAARLPHRVLPEAARIIARHGGEIVTENSAPTTTYGIGVEAESPTRK